MAKEIERKFRVRSDAWRAEIQRSTLLRQGYLANNERVSVRVRLEGEQALLSVKSMERRMSRDEYEVPVPVEDAREMLDRLCEGIPVEKWRHIVVHEGSEWEIDEFLGANAGLVIAELELESEDAAFAHPSWLGPEVTDEERYYNFRLSQKPYRHWPQNLRAGP
jgi:adenylate cyclase